jgi:hypothetical protein
MQEQLRFVKQVDYSVSLFTLSTDVLPTLVTATASHPVIDD